MLSLQGAADADHGDFASRARRGGDASATSVLQQQQALQKLRGAFDGFPITRTIVYSGLYWGTLVLRSYQQALQRSGNGAFPDQDCLLILRLQGHAGNSRMGNLFFPKPYK